MRNTAPTSTSENRNPLLAIENDCIISKQADITVGFKVSLPELFTLTGSEYEKIHGTWVKAIKILPPFTIIHKQDYYTKQSYEASYSNSDDGISFMTRSFQEHFIERPYLDHCCYLFITKTADEKRERKSTTSTLCRGNLIPKAMLDATIVSKFMDIVSQFVSIIESTECIKLCRLTEEDYLGKGQELGLLDHYMNLSSDATLSDIELNPDQLKIGDNVVCVHAIADVEDLPLKVSANTRYEKLSTDRSTCFIGFSSPINLLLSHNHIYNQYIFIYDSGEICRNLEKQAKRMVSLSKLSRANDVNAAYINRFLTQASEFGLSAIRCHFNVVSWGKENEKDKIKNDVGSALAMMECRPRQMSVDVPVLFWSGLPGNESDMPKDESFISFLEPAVCFLNNETSFASSLSPFGIKLVDRFTSRPVHVDISDEPMKLGWTTNRNKFILGPSGSGKSFFTNHMVRQYYEQGTHVVLVDIGNSYLGLCQWINQKTNGQDGIYFTYKEDDPIAFNPFFTDDKKFDIEKKESIKTLITTLWKKESEQLARSEEVGLSGAVSLYIHKIQHTDGIRPDFNGFYEFVRDEYSVAVAQENVAKSDFNIDNFLYVLKPYYRGGEYDYLLNSSKQLDLLSKRFVVFELDNIKDHPILFPVVTIIIMETFINKMRKLDGIRKMILIEEAWKAIAKEGMADYIKYLFKTVRKYFGEAVVVAQEAEDILSSPIVKESIINNSDCKILLDQSKYENKFDAIQNVLGLTDKQKAQVLSINRDLDPSRKYKEVYIGLGGSHSAVYAVEVSREEYLMYTTEQTEKMEVLKKASARGGDIELAIREICNK